MTATPTASAPAATPAASVPRAGTAMTLAVWGARLVTGGVFTLSGVAKAIDLRGVQLKIGEYLDALGGWLAQLPPWAVLSAAVVLSVAEFLTGIMMLLGCYRRSSTVIMLLFMAFMLPLTLWIWLADPVADCGCFGDLIVLSNFATFAKNVLVTALLVWPLLGWNRRVRGVFSPYFQWMAAAVCALFIILVALEGYTKQPMLDFRRFPVGTSLIEGDGEKRAEPVYEFVYTAADGRDVAYSLDNLPADAEADGLTFKERRLVSGAEHASDGFMLASDEGDDITLDAIRPDGPQMLVAVAEPLAVNPGQTFAINELCSNLAAQGVELAALLAPGREGLDYWDDIAMADYPVYTLDPSTIRELVRGRVGLVYLDGGRILWKRTLQSTDVADFAPGADPDVLRDDYFDDDPAGTFWGLAILAALLLAALFAANRTGLTLAHVLGPRLRRHAKKQTNQHNPSKE